MSSVPDNPTPLSYPPMKDETYGTEPTTQPQAYWRLIGWLGGRKFIAVMGTLIQAGWLVHGKHIADGVYSAVIIAVVAAYVTANVAQKVMAKKQQTSETVN